jgi:methylated-DNA-[protein]-cysteine S-methyltransferase
MSLGFGDEREVGAGPLALAVLESTLGPVHVAASAAGIHGLELRTTSDAFAASVARRTGRATQPLAEADPAARAIVHRLEVELAEHVAGRRHAFSVPVILEGVSAWDRRVLAGVREIPWGATAGYGEIARRIGAPGAARAVGGAVGRNPVGLLVPCHRVIAGDGTLGGYGGSWFGSREELLELKRALLAVEGVAVGRR